MSLGGEPKIEKIKVCINQQQIATENSMRLSENLLTFYFDSFVDNTGFIFDNTSNTKIVQRRITVISYSERHRRRSAAGNDIVRVYRLVVDEHCREDDAAIVPLAMQF